MDLERDFNIATPSYGHLSTKMHSLVLIELLYASTSRIGIRIGWSVYLLLIDVGCYKAECNLEISILSLRRHYKSFSFLISEETELPQEFGRVFRIFEPASWSLTNGHHREKTYKTALTRSMFLPRDTDGPF